MQLKQVFETQITSLSLLNSYCQPNTLEVPRHQRTTNPNKAYAVVNEGHKDV